MVWLHSFLHSHKLRISLFPPSSEWRREIFQEGLQQWQLWCLGLRRTNCLKTPPVSAGCRVQAPQGGVQTEGAAVDQETRHAVMSEPRVTHLLWESRAKWHHPQSADPWPSNWGQWQRRWLWCGSCQHCHQGNCIKHPRQGCCRQLWGENGGTAGQAGSRWRRSAHHSWKWWRIGRAGIWPGCPRGQKETTLSLKCMSRTLVGGGEGASVFCGNC